LISTNLLKSTSHAHVEPTTEAFQCALAIKFAEGTSSDIHRHLKYLRQAAFNVGKTAFKFTNKVINDCAAFFIQSTMLCSGSEDK